MKILIGLLLSLLVSFGAMAQDEVVESARTAIKSGGAKELSRILNDGAEVGIDGQKANYSRTQVEFVLKDFFKKYPPVDFAYIHQGASKEGLKYAIGKYTSDKGSFRVYFVIKQIKGHYVIDTLDFSKE
ncbi:protein of unknown function [Flexibacter flexilis DSM 6793]|uniref:DUF4783 domain-containing protein n=1 Tax=Flexibacter flexilis DSM 6793 TaxID=927664 RepID=A0A1I1FNW1_9BACT|nr:DUF4783 domain-containing protein [Flexibacter flexilis]SFC01229.1 protein of unknown function [Flexibacter flexilis DSM 6793]